MVEFTWKNELSVANAILDAQHQMLIDLVNRVELAIRAKDKVLLPVLLEQLLTAVTIHFQTEENFAHAINLPFADHKLLHDYVKGELLIMVSDYANLVVHWSESAAECSSYFLSEWFYDHLNGDVIALKPILENYPYDYAAGSLENN